MQKKLGFFTLGLLSTVFSFSGPAKATTYTYTGNTTITGDPAASNSINVTTGGTLTVTNGSTFTNNAGSTFNNSFLTTIDKGTAATSTYTNYGTSNLGNINMNGSTFNNILNSTLTAKNMTGTASTFYTNGASSFTNINMSAGSKVIENTSGSIIVVSGQAVLDKSSIELYSAKANMNELILNNQSTLNFGFVSNNTFGNMSMNGGSSGTNNGGINATTYSMSGASTITNGGTMKLGSTSLTGINTALNNNGSFTSGSLDVSSSAAFNNSAAKTANVTGATTLSNSGKINNNGTLNLTTVVMTSGSVISNPIGANLTLTGAASLDASTINNGGTANLKDITALNNSTINNNSGTFTANNVSTNSSRINNASNMNLATMNLVANSTLSNTATGTLTVTGASVLDASTLTNSKSANLKNVTAQNGSTITNNANATFTASTTTTSASNVNNNGTMNLANLNLLAGSALTNAATTGSLTVTGSTALDASTFVNSHNATLKGVTAQNGSTITNNANSTLSSTSMTNANSILNNSGTANLGALAGIDNSTINNIAGTLTATSTGLSASKLNNSATASLGDVTMVLGSILDNTATGTLTANNISTSASKIENANIANINSINLTNGSTLANDATGVLKVTSTSATDASTIDNAGTATFTDLGLNNGSTLNNTAGTFTAQLLAANASDIVNDATLNLANLSLSNSSNLINNATGTLTVASGGTTSIDTSTLTNIGNASLANMVLSNATVTNDAGATFVAETIKASNISNVTNNGDMTLGLTRFDTGSILTNNDTLTLTESNAFIGGHFVNNGTADFNSNEPSAIPAKKYTTISYGGTFTNNSGATFDGNGFNFNNGGILLNQGDASLKWISADINNIITNDVGGTMTIADASLNNNSTLNNAGQLDMDILYMSNGSTFNGLEGGVSNTKNLTAALGSSINLNKTMLNVDGKLTIGEGSILNSDNEYGFDPSVSKITVASGIDVYGTFKGSANIDNTTSDMIVYSGGVIDMAAKDGLNLSGNIKFEAGSKYIATIDTLGNSISADDLQSQIRAHEATFEKGSIISIGADKRSNDHTKRYDILHTDVDNFINDDDLNEHLELRNSFLTGYGATWVPNDPEHGGKHVLYIGVTTKPINSLTSLTHNEMEMAELFNTISPRRDLANELNTTLDYLFTQVADERSLARIMRSLTLETNANYLNYMPTFNRMMSQGANTRLTGLRVDGEGKANNLWVTPFGSAAKQKHSEDVLERDIQGFDADLYGISAGADKTFENGLLAGGMISYGNIDFKGDYTADKITANGVQLGLYGSKSIGDWFVDSKASYSHLWSESQTKYQEPTYLTTKGDFDTSLYAFDLKGGYNFKFGEFGISPSVGVDVVHARQGSYTESGAGGLSRDVNAASLTSIELPVRLQFDWKKTFDNNMTFKPIFYVEYAREVGDNMAEMTSEFIGSGTTLDADSLENDSNRYTVGTDIGFEINPMWEVALKYNGDFRKDFTNNTLMFSTEYKF